MGAGLGGPQGSSRREGGTQGGSREGGGRGRLAQELGAPPSEFAADVVMQLEAEFSLEVEFSCLDDISTLDEYSY